MLRPQLSPPHIIVLSLCLLTIATASGLPGFMVAHAGTAGAHLLSSAINMQGAPLFLRADMLFADGSLQPYNHHPPLFFWLQALVTYPFNGLLAKLTAAHYLSATISAATLLLTFHLLRSAKITEWPAALAVAAICGTRMYATYRGFPTFDVLSPLFSILFIITISKIEEKPSKNHIKWFILLSLLALSTSYYAITIIAAYLGTKILLNLKRQGILQTLKSWPFLTAIALASFVVLEVILLQWQEYLATNALSSLQNALGRQTNLNSGSLPESPVHIATVLIRRLLECLPLVPLALAAIPLAAYVRPILASITSTPLLRATLYVTIGGTLFIALTPVWSKVHPFAFLWFTGPIAAWTAILLQSAPPSKTKQLVALTLINCAPIWLLYGYYRDYQHANATSPLLKTAQNYSQTTFYMNNLNLECGEFTAGNITFIGTYPNRWLALSGKATPAQLSTPHVEINCQNNTLNFTPQNGANGTPASVTFGESSR